MNAERASLYGIGLGAVRTLWDRLGEAFEDSAEVARDVELELAAHLELAADDLERGGIGADAARALALQRFGDVRRVQRDCMDIRQGRSRTMKRLLIASNVLLVGAVVLIGLRWRAATVQAREALNEAQMAYAAAMQHQVELAQAKGREGAATAEQAALGPRAIATGDVVEYVDRHRRVGFGSRERVGPDGQILLPHLGWVQVSGLTRDELAARLTEQYTPYYDDLVIDVIVYPHEDDVR